MWESRNRASRKGGHRVMAEKKSRMTTVQQPQRLYPNRRAEAFPGGPVVKNSPAKAREMCSTSGPGRSLMLWSN